MHFPVKVTADTLHLDQEVGIIFNSASEYKAGLDI